MITIKIDNTEIEAEAGANLLQVCLGNDIYIPHLCHIGGMQTPPAACRMCMVTVCGEKTPVTACTTRVRDGMAVATDTTEVRRLQRSALHLLLSVHDIDCRNCSANKHCELQNIARFLKVGLKAGPYEKLLKDKPIDSRHPCLDYYPNRCVLCGKCMHACEEKNGRSVFTFARRGFDTVISTYGVQTMDISCGECKACVDICPVGALAIREDAAPETVQPNGF